MSYDDVTAFTWTTANGYTETILPGLGVLDYDCFYCGVEWYGSRTAILESDKFYLATHRFFL